jgi:hypothetical protein
MTPKAKAKLARASCLEKAPGGVSERLARPQTGPTNTLLPQSLKL